MRKEDKLLMRSEDALVIRTNGVKNVIKPDRTTIGYALSWMLSVSVYKIRKNATFINKIVI